MRLRKPRPLFAVLLVATVVGTTLAPTPAAATGQQLMAQRTTAPGASGSGDDDRPTTAWRDGALRVDEQALISRSDVVLEGPAWQPWMSMPLGNGRLGAGVWARDGFTAQFNRVDLFPDLKSPGQLVVPGLDRLVRSSDYAGRLDLYDGVLVQSGGGMTAIAYVHALRDLFVLDVTGADPETVQTADLRLWQGRQPTTYAHGRVAALAEAFTDAASGHRSGAIAAVTAAGRDVSTEVVDDLTVRISFKPHRDGSFRLMVAVPFYTGDDVAAAAQGAVSSAQQDASAGRRVGGDAGLLAATHRAWWHRFWQGTSPMKITSTDGAGEYLENLRVLQLYTTAASMRGGVPSSHGAVIGLFSSFQDHFDWSPAGFWHFNLRMQTAANFAADTEEFNAPYFRLYQDNLDTIRAWTSEHWPGSDGICVSETIRFDGTGSYPGEIQCDTDSPPNFVVRILSSGPEVALNMWRQYRYTNDEAFLDRAYPFMADVVRFYLSVAKEGPDGLLHLEHVNALENQWDTRDPATDLAAMTVLFPLVAQLAEARGDEDLAARLRSAAGKIPPFRIVQRNGEDVIAWSATDEPAKNFQNPDLEPVWPWGLFGDDDGEQTELARATFRQRVNPQSYDWAMDSTWAARLGLADEIPSLLVQGTKDFQIFPNGFGRYSKGGSPQGTQSFYNEWGGVVTTGLQEALIQSYDGLLRVPAAWPAQWDVDAALKVEGGHRVSVQVRDGVANHVGIEAARSETLRVRNPWPGQEVRVIDGRTGRGAPVVRPTTDEIVTIPVQAGRSYLLERTEVPYPSFAFAAVTGAPATAAKHLGTRTIGVLPSTPPPPCVPPTGDGPLVDWNPESGTDMVDASEYHRDGIVVGSVQYADGPDGPALLLDGSDYVQSKDPVNFGPLDAATFLTQVRIDSSGSYRRLFDYIVPGSPGDVGFLVDVDPGNRVRFIGAGQVAQTTVAVPTGRFVTLAVTLAADGILTVYLDGEQAWTGALTARPINGCGEMKLQFGADQAGGSRLAGAVDDIRIWPRALTADEISGL